MLNLRRCVAGVVAVLLMSGVALAQTRTDIAALRVKANAGDADAQNELGGTYFYGDGVPKDQAEGVSWWRKAAEQGDVGAQSILGVLYEDGRGVQRDYVEGTKWTRKAAEQGDAMAQHKLGYAYQFGQGVPQDYVEAHKWYNLALSRADPLDREKYSLYLDMQGWDMTPQQVAEAQQLAREWQAAFDAWQE